ncbi:hypothetical protein KQX54_021221 [Cotesia glomerata]|uniref:Uncharacterized protein n=1 Tax=Cotesia glomerata TaxID=32391 RepID=A0AAV7I3Z9_COTGL|nr:hypothetical protein KQX54_021221 [Cotesia glomerata]
MANAGKAFSFLEATARKFKARSRQPATSKARTYHMGLKNAVLRIRGHQSKRERERNRKKKKRERKGACAGEERLGGETRRGGSRLKGAKSAPPTKMSIRWFFFVEKMKLVMLLRDKLINVVVCMEFVKHNNVSDGERIQAMNYLRANDVSEQSIYRVETVGIVASSIQYDAPISVEDDTIRQIPISSYRPIVTWLVHEDRQTRLGPYYYEQDSFPSVVPVVSIGYEYHFK